MIRPGLSYTPQFRPSARGSAGAGGRHCLGAEAARTAPSLEVWPDCSRISNGCALKSTATRLVFADGTRAITHQFVGEAPGREKTRRDCLCRRSANDERNDRGDRVEYRAFT